MLKVYLHERFAFTTSGIREILLNFLLGRSHRQRKLSGDFWLAEIKLNEKRIPSHPQVVRARRSFNHSI